MSDSMEDLLNTPEPVEAFGKTYQIKRFSLGQIVRAAEHLAPLGFLVRTAMASMQSAEQIGELIAQALMTAGPPALGLLSVATEEPVEWLEEQDPIEAFTVLSFTVEKNARYFFAPANKSRIEAAFARIQQAVKKETQPESGKSATSSVPVDTAH